MSADEEICIVEIIDPLDICRTCMSEKIPSYIDILGGTEPFMAQYVNDYYKVEVTADDGQSSKLCQQCIQNIDVWLGHLSQAKRCQMVLKYLAEKKYKLTTTRTVKKGQSDDESNKKKVTVSKRSRKRRRSSSKPKLEIQPSEIVDESIQQSTTEIIDESIQQSTLEIIDESIQQSTSEIIDESIQQSTSEIIDESIQQSTSEIIDESIQQSTSEIIDESIQQSTSEFNDQILLKDKESVQYESDIPSISRENIPYSSSSSDNIPFISSSMEIVQFSSSSTEIIPFTSSSMEIIQFSSSSTEIIPFTSSSPEIIPSLVSPEVQPIGHLMINGVNDESPSEIFTRPKSLKAEYICIFCNYQYDEISVNVLKNVLFCSKHAKPYACLVEGCHTIFPNKEVFTAHYRTHLNLNSSTFLCRKCFGILACPRRTVVSQHTHQHLPDLLKCCSLSFSTMTRFVIHKIINHSAIVITANNKSHVLKNSNINPPKKQETQPNDFKDGDMNVPSKVPCTEVEAIKGNRGRYKCQNCTQYFTSVIKYIQHSKIKHKNEYKLKDPRLQLCPLCNNSFLLEHVIDHIEKCTHTFRVGPDNNYGCIYCRFIFPNLTARQFRNHLIYCRSFKLITVNNKLFQKCNNCTFQSDSDTSCLQHANSNCIDVQLRMRYALEPDEFENVEKRILFNMQNAKQLVNTNCTNEQELPSTSRIICDTTRQHLLQSYNFYCGNCDKVFFGKTIFLKHLSIEGSHCRPDSLIYCQKCVRDFETEEAFIDHLPTHPKAIPLISIKQEVIDQNNDEDIIMDVIVEHPDQDDYSDVKVFEINNSRFFQKQEPVNNYDLPNNMQYQEHEISNVGFNNSYECQEMEINDNDDYMQCVVEDKHDLNQLLIEKNM